MAAVTQQDPSSTSPPPTEPDETLEQRLERLDGELTAARDAETEASFEVTDLQGRIDALTRLQNDLDKAKDDYAAAYPDLVEGEEARRVYYDYETQCLTDIVGAAKTTIEQADTDAEEELTDAKEAVQDAEAKLADLKDERTEADEARKPARTLVDELKNLKATINARLKTLDNIKTSVNAAQKDNQYALAYWLLVMGEFSSILEREPKLMHPTELPDALLAAVIARSDAEGAYAAKDLEVSQQQAVVVEAKAHLQTVTKEYDQKLRDALMKIKPAEPSAPSEPAEPPAPSEPAEPPAPSEPAERSDPSEPSEPANSPTHEETNDA
jgi:DNA repair exonuclease SbcCD ATPase subunit